MAARREAARPSRGEPNSVVRPWPRAEMILRSELFPAWPKFVGCLVWTRGGANCGKLVFVFARLDETAAVGKRA